MCFAFVVNNKKPGRQKNISNWNKIEKREGRNTTGWQKERVCVCVKEREREEERKKDSRKSVCMCVCVRESVRGTCAEKKLRVQFLTFRDPIKIRLAYLRYFFYCLLRSLIMR